MNDGLSEKHLAIIHEILAPHQAITHALLFGSRARGAFKPTSDVDIAIKGAITIRLIAKIKAEFAESNLPFFVDIVDYAKADNTLKARLMHKARFSILQSKISILLCWNLIKKGFHNANIKR